MDTAKLLMNGDTQAVILPKEFQFQGSEVLPSALSAKITQNKAVQ